MTPVALTFSADELIVESGFAETAAVEKYLARTNLEHRKTLIGWDRIGDGTYKFIFCGPNASHEEYPLTEPRLTPDGISLAPWQIFIFSTADGDSSCLKGSTPFRTVHLASELTGMHVGDPIEIIRISDMLVMGHAIVTAVKTTWVSHLNMLDVKDFLFIIGQKGHTIPRQPGHMMARVLSDYYNTAVQADTELTVIEMQPSNDSYRVNSTGPLETLMSWFKPAITAAALIAVSLSMTGFDITSMLS